jgi:hypothetical protein
LERVNNKFKGGLTLYLITNDINVHSSN